MKCFPSVSVVITARKRSLGQGNIFTGVCDSFCLQGEGGCLPLGPGGGHTHPQTQTPPRAHPHGQQTGGTHPTGMLSCLGVQFDLVEIQVSKLPTFQSHRLDFPQCLPSGFVQCAFLLHS